MRRSLASRSAAIAGMAECGGHRGKRTDEEKRIANKLAQEMCRARKKQGLPPVKKGRKRKAESTQLFGGLYQGCHARVAYFLCVCFLSLFISVF